MIEVVFYKTKEKEYRGFNCLGHAGYAASGEDIVCAAVSALVINTVNSIRNFTDEKIRLVTNEEEGLIQLMFEEAPGHDASLLMNSLYLGLSSIQDGNKEYIHMIFEEV